MAKAALELIVSLRDEASAGLTRLQSALGGIARALPGIALAAGAAGAITALGKSAWQAGQEFDQAFDTIQIQTGATGEALQTLQRDFSAVFSRVPSEVGPVADVISALNTRLGVTGPALQGMAVPLLEMARLLGTDVNQAASDFTRVMGDWGVPVEAAAGQLDKLFVASQATGIGINRLMQQVVQFGSPLRLMGFSLDEATALFAKFEKEGVNAETVVGSLRIAAAKFAKDGISMRDGLQETMKAIRGTTDASEALAIGMKVFGARAGPDMVAAIREGRFAIEDLVTQMATADGAIMRTAEATADFGERWQIIGNRLKTALAPIGIAMMDVVTTAVEKLLPAVDGVVAFIGDKWPKIQTIIGGVTSRVRELWDTHWPALQARVAAWWAGVQPQIGEAAGLIRERLGEAVGQVRALWDTHWPALQEGIQKLADFFGPTIERIREAIADLGTELAPVGPAFAQLLEVVRPVLTTFAQIVGVVVAIVAKLLGEVLAAALRNVGDVATGAIQMITGAFEVGQGIISGIINAIAALLRGDFAGAWEEAKKGVETAAKGFSDAIDGALKVIDGVIGTIWDSLTQFVGDLLGVNLPKWDEFKSKVEGIWQTIRDKITGAIDAVRSALDNIKTFLGGLTLPNPFAAIANILDSLIEKASKLPGLLGNLLGGGTPPGHATGTFFAPGGMAVVGEQGPEVVLLPRGAQVRSRGETIGQAIAPSVVNNSTIIIQDRAALALYLDRIRREQGLAIAGAYW